MSLRVFSRYTVRYSLRPVLLLAVSVILASSVHLSWGGVSGVRLESICAEPDSLTAEEYNVPVIMLHELTDVKETWNGIYEFVSSLTNRKVCVYDARNHGRSSWNDTLTIDSTVEDLGSFMNTTKIDRAFLVGHSMGGLTVMKFALSNPGRVDGLFVEDVAPKIPDEFYEFMVFYVKILQNSLSAIPDGADRPTAKKAVLDFIKERTKNEPPGSYLEDMPLHLHNGEWQWKTNLELIKKILETSDAFYDKMEGQYRGKALFIYGKSSMFKVGGQEEDIKEMFPNVKFVGIEGASHVIHYAYPEFMKQLLDFLE